LSAPLHHCLPAPLHRLPTRPTSLPAHPTTTASLHHCLPAHPTSLPAHPTTVSLREVAGSTSPTTVTLRSGATRRVQKSHLSNCGVWILRLRAERRREGRPQKEGGRVDHYSVSMSCSTRVAMNWVVRVLLRSRFPIISRIENTAGPTRTSLST